MVALARAEAVRWQRAVTTGYTYTFTVTVLDALGRPVPCPPVPVQDVRLAVAANPAGWWSGSITVPIIDGDGRDWRPKTWSSPLSPWGNRLRISMRATGDDGTTQEVLLATLLIDTVTVRRPEQIMTVTLVDTLAELAQFDLPFDYPGTGDQERSTRDIANRIIAQARVPSNPRISDANDPDRRVRTDMPWKWAGGGGKVYNAGADALDAVQDIVRLTSARNMLRTARDGSWLVDNLAGGGSPVARLADGDGGAVVSLTSTLSRRDAVNGVVVRVDDTEKPQAENPAPPSSAIGLPDGSPAGPSMAEALRAELLKRVLGFVWLAQAQLGTGETGGTNRYIQAYGLSAGVDWCDVFITWLLDNCPGGPVKTPPGYTSWASVMFFVDNAWRRLSALGQTRTDNPRNGDIAFYRIQHVGLVEDASTWRSGYVTTIEGNASEMVRRQRVPLSQLRGFFTPNWLGF